MGSPEAPLGTHGVAPFRSSHDDFARFTLPGSMTALLEESFGFRFCPAPQGGCITGPDRMGPGSFCLSVRPCDSWGPRPPWPSWVHFATGQGGGHLRPPFPAGARPSGFGGSSCSVQPWVSWGPRPGCTPCCGKVAAYPHHPLCVCATVVPWRPLPCWPSGAWATVHAGPRFGSLA